MILPALLALALAAPGAGAPPPSVRDEVRSYLGAIDRPVTAETWRALGPEAEPLLAEVAGAADEPPSRRARALEGLAARGGARAEAVHRRLALEARAPPLVRSAAVRGLGALLAPAQAAVALRPLLGDPAPRVRQVAGEVLARRAPAEGCAAVRAQAAREGAGRFARALSLCDRAGRGAQGR